MPAVPPTVGAVRFEHGGEVLGIGTPSPRLSWKVDAGPGWRQAAYIVEIARSGSTEVVRVTSPDQVLVPWPAAPLTSRDRAAVRVQLEGEDGRFSDWSPVARVEAGLLDVDDWTAAGIQPGWTDGDAEADRRPPVLRREFTLGSAVEWARVYVTAHGLFELEVNGRRVGGDALTPGWTPYRDRLRYVAYDVTDLLRQGTNAIGAWLGDGWWRGRLGFHGGTPNIYGTDIALLGQLEIGLSDGTVERIVTDRSWRSHRSPIVSSGLYTGEVRDAGAELPGFSEPGFDDSGWDEVRIAEFAFGTLTALDSPPVRHLDTLAPVSVERLRSGALLVDFGQNFAGRLHLAAASGVGPELTIRHAEVLQDGALYTRTLRGATSVDRYLGSSGAIDWEPKFTIHGFRYAEITGYDGPVDGLRISGRVYHSVMERTGWLTTSNVELNRLHDNVLWSMRSNFVDIPTDCPQRDERLGWTGDIQVFAPTASYLYDCSGFLASWMKDLALEQRRYGTVPWYVPVIPGDSMWTPIRPGAAWGDAATLVPWTLWQRFADAKELDDQYGSAKAWVDQIDRLAGPSHLWNTGMQLGDWLDPAAPPDNPLLALTDPYLVATAFFARSAAVVGRMAALTGRDVDALRYSRLAEDVRVAFLAEWTSAPGVLQVASQTGYALAIEFGLFRESDEIEIAGAALADLVRSRGNRIGAGFAGVNLVADALSRTGHLDTAFDLLLEPETPSWLSMVRKGATTIWERWDSLLDDGTVNSGEMTSFNHYALGSIADWMHRFIGGIVPLEPGYRRVRIAPRVGGGIDSADARFESAYGTIAVSWRVEDGRFFADVTIPTGVTADLDLPGGRPEVVGSGVHRFDLALMSQR